VINEVEMDKSILKLVNETKIAGRVLSGLIEEIQTVYLADERPWLVGFSGGKDSTVILSLVYTAILQLDVDKRRKHIYVVSSDTLVETPVVVGLIQSVIKTINKSAKEQNLPITAHSVYPKVTDTFWVSLLGKGYPAPKQKFRWCTERMKINPVSNFITDKVAEYGEVILALGSRSEESSSRAKVIDKHKIGDSVLSRHSTLPNAFIYLPINDWTADDVWNYLMSAPCPWGGDNQELFELYKGSNQGECPLVVDTSTPSCGNSRFGCWTCTVVTKDRALEGLIQTGESWMQPLLDFRNGLYDSTIPENKTKYRNFKRRMGKVTYINNKDAEEISSLELSRHIPGPYWLKQRKEWLKELLTIEKHLKDTGHDFQLIREEELHEIRQEWLRDPNEPDWVDSLPKIYADVYGKSIEWINNDAGAFTELDASILQKLEAKHSIPSELIMKLVEVELSMSGLSKRTGILNNLENVLSKDWGSLEQINERNKSLLKHNVWKEKLNTLKEEYESLTK
jgi:DNA sulfur modification protein DndC